MGRRKYQFGSRAEAERAYREADSQRLLTEWLLTALLEKTTREVGSTADCAVGYVVLNHSAIVYALNHKPNLHRVKGIWDVDDVRFANLIASVLRTGRNGLADFREFGELLEKAKNMATGALLAVA